MKYNRGDIVIVDFNPVRGHEQGMRRPALVMNSVPLPGDLNIVLPVTSKFKSYPLEVTLDNRTKIQGTIMCYQARTLDLNSRNARVVETAPADIVDTCAEYMHRLTS